MPGENTTILVEEISLDSNEKKKVTERLCAEIKKENEANISGGKAGFEFCGEVKDCEDNICAFWPIITPKKD